MEEKYDEKREWINNLSFWEVNEKVELLTDLQKLEMKRFYKAALFGNLPYDDHDKYQWQKIVYCIYVSPAFMLFGRVYSDKFGHLKPKNIYLNFVIRATTAFKGILWTWMPSLYAGHLLSQYIFMTGFKHYMLNEYRKEL